MPGIQADGPPLFWKLVPVIPNFLPSCTTSPAIWLQTGSWLAVGITKSFLPVSLEVSKAGPGGTKAGTALALETSDWSVETCEADRPWLPPEPPCEPGDDEHAVTIRAGASSAAAAMAPARR